MSVPADVVDVGVVEMEIEGRTPGLISTNYVSPMVYEIHIRGSKANLDCVADMLSWPDTVQVDKDTNLSVHTKAERVLVPIDPKDCIADQLDEFARSIRGETVPETGAKEALSALAVVEAALLSERTNSWIDSSTLLPSLS
jgi:predicted dehydrogenase